MCNGGAFVPFGYLVEVEKDPHSVGFVSDDLGAVFSFAVQPCYDQTMLEGFPIAKDDRAVGVLL